MRFNILDLMRFVAALCVVLYHYTAGEYNASYGFFAEVTKFGYLGVPLFFMLSGFVISASALNRTPAEFAISRLTRLYPTIFVCLSISTLVMVLFGGVEIQPSVKQFISNLTLLNTYVGEEYIDGVYWTLLAELKFYFCVFLLLALGLFAKFKIWLSCWMLMTVTFLMFGQPFFMGWFISPEYSAFFIAGVTFFLAAKNGYNKFYISLLALSFIVGNIWETKHADGFMERYAPGQLDHIIVFALICSFYTLFYLISKQRIQVRKSQFLLILGGMTYPLYLLHGRIGNIAYKNMTDFDPMLLLALLISLMLVLSYLVHTYVEKKIANSIKNYLFDILNLYRERNKVSDLNKDEKNLIKNT
ncbi:MAG: acyltransferase family protein [Gammaproteobacteria bacterium]